MIDAIWDYYQHHYPQHSKKWHHDRKRRIIWYHTPRYWYVDNTNLERCGLKIKYENIFPKKVSLKPNNGRHGGNHAGWEPYNGGYSNFHDQEEDEEREKFYEDSSSGQQELDQNEEEKNVQKEIFDPENDINDDITDRYHDDDQYDEINDDKKKIEMEFLYA